MFNALPMLQNTITATADAMSILAAAAQAFQTDGYKQTRYSFQSIFNHSLKSIGTSKYWSKFICSKPSRLLSVLSNFGKGKSSTITPI